MHREGKVEDKSALMAMIRKQTICEHRMPFERGLKIRVGDQVYITKSGLLTNKHPNEHSRVRRWLIKRGWVRPTVTWRVGFVLSTATYYGDGMCTVALV